MSARSFAPTAGSSPRLGLVRDERAQAHDAGAYPEQLGDVAAEGVVGPGGPTTACLFLSRGEAPAPPHAENAHEPGVLAAQH